MPTSEPESTEARDRGASGGAARTAWRDQDLSPFEPDVATALRPHLVDGEVVLRLGEPRRARAKVLLPVRNAEASLVRAIESVLAQEGVDVQLVVVDNASTDGSFRLACAYAARDPRVVAYRNPRDVGRIGNWNRALGLAGPCDYVKLLMANDVLLPRFLADAVAAGDANPGVSLVVSSLSILHPDGRVEFHPNFPGDLVLPGAEARRWSLVSGNVAAGPSGQLFRAVCAEGLRFDPALPWAADYDLTLRLLERGDLAYLRRRLFLFEVGAGRFHGAAGPAQQLRDECAVAVRHTCPDALPRLERVAARLGGGPALEGILAEARAALAPVALDARGITLLLPLEDGWHPLLRAYLTEIRPEEDVTLVLKPLPGSDQDAVVAALTAEIGDGAATPDLLLEASDIPAARLVEAVDAVLRPGASPRALADAARPRVPRPAVPLVHVVMPIGVGAPGTPVLRHLRSSLDCLARQTFRDFRLTVAADDNISPEARSMVESFGAEIVWYPRDTYFRPGGIWKKITDGWQSLDSQYVAYFHYDDLWALDKLERQVRFAESRGLTGCWTRGYRIGDDAVLSGDVAVLSDDIALPTLEPSQAGIHPGAWTLHSLLLRRDAILESGIMEHEQRWAAIFEQLLFLYVLRIGNVEKCHDTAFYYRDHPMTVTHTLQEHHAYVQEQRANTAYSLAQTLADADAIDFEQLAYRLKAAAE